MPLDASLEPVIDAASRDNNVDPTLLKSLILTESHGDPRAVSPAGAMGLTQLMPDTARGLADNQGHPIVTDPFDPIQSIYGGAKYLAQGLDKYGDPVKALMFYHGGPDESQWGAKTAAYPGAIAGLYQQLRAGPQTNGKPMNGTDALAAAGNSDPYLAAYANDPRMATSPVAAQPNAGIALLARAGNPQPGPMPDLSKMSDDDIVNGLASGSLPMLPGLSGTSP